MMTKFGSVRASTAALTRSTISSFGTTSLPGRWPQRFSPTWSSMCTRRAPALMSERTVRAMLNAAPSRCRYRPAAADRDIGDAAHVDQHVVHRADAEIGQPERIGGDAAARQVKRLEAGALGHQRVIGVDRADHLQRLFGGERGAETAAAGGVELFEGVLMMRTPSANRNRL